MSLIQFREQSEGRYIVFCPKCKKQVMIAKMDEIADLAKHNIIPLCFDCVPLGVDKVPSHIMSALDVYLIGFGDASFIAFWKHHKEAGEYELRCVPVDGPLWNLLNVCDLDNVASLSSSTYLHKFLNTEEVQSE